MWRAWSWLDVTRGTTPSRAAWSVAALLLISVVACHGLRGPGAELGISPELDERGQDGASMAWIPAGSFLRGSTWGEVEYAFLMCEDARPGQCRRPWYLIEAPQAEVTLDAFWIDVHEVTNARYQACVDAGACPEREWASCQLWDTGGWRVSLPDEDVAARFGAARQPAVCVTWDNAGAYCRWAGKRLPTEAEWEKAARGPAGWLFPWGNAGVDCDRARHHSPDQEEPGCGVGATAPVGSAPTGMSAYGLMDAAGNASEWVQDFEDPGFYARSPTSNPINDQESAARVVRGGSWASDPSVLRSTSRGGFAPNHHNVYTGFRCAADP